jgi:hypothetical protein
MQAALIPTDDSCIDACPPSQHTQHCPAATPAGAMPPAWSPIYQQPGGYPTQQTLAHQPGHSMLLASPFASQQTVRAMCVVASSRQVQNGHDGSVAGRWQTCRIAGGVCLWLGCNNDTLNHHSVTTVVLPGLVCALTDIAHGLIDGGGVVAVCVAAEQLTTVTIHRLGFGAVNGAENAGFTPMLHWCCCWAASTLHTRWQEQDGMD